MEAIPGLPSPAPMKRRMIVPARQVHCHRSVDVTLALEHAYARDALPAVQMLGVHALDLVDPIPPQGNAVSLDGQNVVVRPCRASLLGQDLD